MSEAEDLLRAAADLGLPTACAELGAFLWHVRETGEDALPWLRTAADAGEAHAMALLGDIHDHLDDQATAIEWYTRAAALGDEQAAGPGAPRAPVTTRSCPSRRPPRRRRGVSGTS